MKDLGKISLIFVVSLCLRVWGEPDKMVSDCGASILLALIVYSDLHMYVCLFIYNICILYTRPFCLRLPCCFVVEKPSLAGHRTLEQRACSRFRCVFP